jgi:hypothetical protein
VPKPTSSAGATTATRVWWGKVGRRRRSFSIFVGASGFLRARLHVRGRPDGSMELSLRRGERSIAVARGRTSLRLHAPVRRGTYRLVLTSSGGRPVRFKLALAYPRAR